MHSRSTARRKLDCAGKRKETNTHTYIYIYILRIRSTSHDFWARYLPARLLTYICIHTDKPFPLPIHRFVVKGDPIFLKGRMKGGEKRSMGEEGDEKKNTGRKTCESPLSSLPLSPPIFLSKGRGGQNAHSLKGEGRLWKRGGTVNIWYLIEKERRDLDR